MRAINLESNVSANESILENYDVILHIGGRVVSSKYDKYVTENSIPLLRFSSCTHRQDPGNNLSAFFTTSIKQFCEFFEKKTFNTDFVSDINGGGNFNPLKKILVISLKMMSLKNNCRNVMKSISSDHFVFR